MNLREKALCEGGKRLSAILGQALKTVEVGATLFQINAAVERQIKDLGLKPSFKTVRDYQWATCLNLNEGVVHGIPDQRSIVRGDLLSLDLGLIFRGWHLDMAYTLEVESKKEKRFLTAGQEALEKAVFQARAGNQVKDISRAIQKTIEAAGYQVVSQLTGHGIGRFLHEPPSIPGIVTEGGGGTEELKEGMALAIEVIYTKGEGKIKTETDGWTISTQDGKIAGLFEKTILVGLKKAEELTPYNWKNVQG